jgi:hypothetical protein
MLTARSIGQPRTGDVASNVPAAVATSDQSTNPAGGPGGEVAPATTRPSEGTAGRSPSISRPAPAPNSGSARAGDARLVSQNEYSDVVYSREISMLQEILRTRRAQLDPATVAIIERNLNIIDAAIAQSKAALSKDPASQLLGEQLTHALDKKVELLRTAAMLPLST